MTIEIHVNHNYPEVFMMDVTTGDSRQALILSLDSLRELKGQIGDALAEYNQLKKTGTGYWTPQ
jgi:hypothetical protein